MWHAEPPDVHFMGVAYGPIAPTGGHFLKDTSTPVESFLRVRQILYFLGCAGCLVTAGTKHEQDIKPSWWCRLIRGGIANAGVSRLN
jgi:hypothetical protein